MTQALTMNALTDLFRGNRELIEVSFLDGQPAAIVAKRYTKLTGTRFDQIEAFVKPFFAAEEFERRLRGHIIDATTRIDDREIQLSLRTHPSMLTIRLDEAPQPTFFNAYRIPMLIGVVIIFVLTALIFSVPVIPR